MKRLTLVSIAMFATVFVIGCERSPTSTEKASSPRFSVVPGSGTWTTKASMLTGRNYSSAGVIDSRRYVVGGGGGLNVNEAYDPLTDTWATKAPAPTPRAFAGAGVIAGKLYVAGGCINSDCITLWAGKVGGARARFSRRSKPTTRWRTLGRRKPRCRPPEETLVSPPLMAFSTPSVAPTVVRSCKPWKPTTRWRTLGRRKPRCRQRETF